jgi:uroporphyrinogen decarboxylase
LTEGGTPWLERGIHNLDELRAKLGELENLSDTQLRALIFSSGGVIEKSPPKADGTPRQRGAFSRGPATMATSVLGTTEFLYLLVDQPAEMHRFFDALADVIIRYQKIIAAEAGVVVRGYALTDDNCALLSPELYEEFCLPVLRRVFAAFAPTANDRRYQHSDSSMEHLLPILTRLNFSAVNFGPTIPAQVIRHHMPRAEIQGQIAPFTLRNKPAEAIIAEVRRDFDAVGADGGLLVTTAGSIAAGTSLQAIRTFMWAVQEHCRYDR